MQSDFNLSEHRYTQYNHHPLSILALSILLIITGASSSRALRSGASAGKSPIWAAQLDWAPYSAALHIDYDSSNTQPPMNGAYQSTTTIFPAEKRIWETYTWKLSNAAFSGRQNSGADLRLSGSPGIAIHQVTLSLQPPSPSSSSGGGDVATITLNTDHSGGNTESGLAQVWAGGKQGDSLYTLGVVAGRSAEIFAENVNVSYLYLRLDRQNALFLKHPATVYATVTYSESLPPETWSLKTFTGFAARGIHYAEVNLEWGALEPKPGVFNFDALDEMMHNAAKAHVRILPIFWSGLWTGNPAPWITQFDVDSAGTPSKVPTWWNHFIRQSYFRYVTATIAHVKNNPGFGGAFLDYGWLDYMWGPNPGTNGVNGYAPEDIARFHAWLPSRFHTISAFNRIHGTHYGSWQAIPAATQGEPLFPVYQEFRSWSVEETYGRLTEMVRHETSAPLYYYWGGGLNGVGVAYNLPDIFFRLAHRYHVTVVLDDADHTGLALLFNSLSRAYHVPLFEEWTPRPTGLHAEIAEFMGHYGLGMPDMVGMDFFLYNGGREFQVGYPQFVRWIPILSRIKGDYPSQPVAVYMSYRPALTTPNALAGFSSRIASMWRKVPTGFTVVTDQEVAAGLINLKHFRAILPLNGRDDPILASYKAHGGRILDQPDRMAQYATPYVTYANDGDMVEAVPTVDRATHSAWITLSGWSPNRSYNGEITIHLAGLGLPNIRYHIVNVVTHASIPCQSDHGKLVANLNIKPGDLLVWRISPSK